MGLICCFVVRPFISDSVIHPQGRCRRHAEDFVFCPTLSGLVKCPQATRCVAKFSSGLELNFCAIFKTQKGHPAGWPFALFDAWQFPTLAWGDPTLPSALRRFTSEFGMGSGGTTALQPPGKFFVLCPVSFVLMLRWPPWQHISHILMYASSCRLSCRLASAQNPSDLIPVNKLNISFRPSTQPRTLLAL